MKTAAYRGTGISLAIIWECWPLRLESDFFQRHIYFFTFVCGFNSWSWEVIVYIDDIGGIVDHHCLNFLFINNTINRICSIAIKHDSISSLYNLVFDQYCLHDNYFQYWKIPTHGLKYRLWLGVMVFNATFNNILAKSKYMEKITDLPQVTDKLIK